ncbi:23S rRNA (guanosine(2251)-2'-O)-methyltransferase RlmB [Marinicellulosiphila megalodicopiae]|uniref:23S rRNA (guanosine(2251)-2'-O)-methyltransferase RlmB n=1 Tax=Marinicellulosiphila megalodicopiae TaxID=2724896 RepID=UPI003BB16D4C
MSEEIVFGIHAVKSLCESPNPRVREIIVQEERKDQRVKALWDLAKEKKIRIKRVNKQSFFRSIDLHKLGDSTHQGVLAFCTQIEQFQESQLDEVLGKAGKDPLVLVLDGVTDPHNLGACLRSADAAGVACVIVPKDNSAQLTSTALKVACGAGENIPLFFVTNLARTLNELKEKGFWLTGTAGEATTYLYDADLSGSRIIVMGAEGDGMRRLTKETCDELVKLPMHGSVSSLNVSVATGICLFEVVRRRMKKA